MNNTETNRQQVCHVDGEKLFDIGWSEESSFFCLIWAKSREEAELRWAESFKEKWESGLIGRKVLSGPRIEEVFE
jgi:hypothetical protein